MYPVCVGGRSFLEVWCPPHLPCTESPWPEHPPHDCKLLLAVPLELGEGWASGAVGVM